MGEVVFKNIRKAYVKDQWVIKGADLVINDGEFCVLLGPSGCGKSTLLRMVAGLEKITEGEILIDGKVINDISPKDRDIAMVFQNYALYPHKTVYDNMAYPLKMQRMSRHEIDKKVKEASSILGLETFLDRYPKQLSGGQRQRVALGRCIVRNPKVYLFDEPLSNLDAKLRGSMRAELKLLHKRFGITFIYVTHDQIEAMTMADKIILLDAGVIQQEGKPEEFYDKPANVFVGSFIGNPPMNFINLYKKDGVFKFGNHTFESSKLGLYDNVILGTRPEKLYFKEVSNKYFEAKILIDELIGKEYLYYIEPLNMEITSPNFAVISTVKVPYDDNTIVKVYFEDSDLRLFESSGNQEAIYLV